MSKEIVKAAYEGVVKKLGTNELNCYVLNDGTRLISQNAVFKAFGRGKRGIRRITDTGIKVPSFMDAKNLEPFIDNQLSDVINPIQFKDNKGHLIYGYKAEVIPLVCDLYLKAREANALTPQQQVVAKTAEIIVRSLAKIGIISLIDEATGYQYERERFELEKILEAYISEEILKWQLTFTDDFYKQIFRLWNIPFTPQYIKRKPIFIGKLTTKYIYEQLPKGVLEKIKGTTPKTDAGNYKYRFHQSLTLDIGREHLKKQIIEVTTLMSISPSKDVFEGLFKKKYNKVVQLELEFNQNVVEPKLTDFNKNLKKALDYKSE
jgi:P63C domain